MAADQPRLYIALYTDEDVTRLLAEQLRADGFDAVSAHEVGNFEISDREQLEYATLQERAILTFNIGDYRRLYDEYWKAGRDHFGIVVSEQCRIGELVRRVLNLLNVIDADQMKNSFRHLGEFK